MRKTRAWIVSLFILSGVMLVGCTKGYDGPYVSDTLAPGDVATIAGCIAATYNEETGFNDWEPSFLFGEHHIHAVYDGVSASGLGVVSIIVPDLISSVTYQYRYKTVNTITVRKLDDAHVSIRVNHVRDWVYSTQSRMHELMNEWIPSCLETPTEAAEENV